MLTGALEVGGTKMVCVVEKGDGTISERVSVPITAPEEIIPKLIEYSRNKGIEILGVAAFGSVDVKPESETYGYIPDTPRLAWRHEDPLGRLKAELKVPMGLDMDVNGPCLGEVTYGYARGLDSVIYVTIETGMGVGVCINGKLLHGILHPEGGHILLVHHGGDSKGGIRSYCKNCLEDSANGPSIKARWSRKAVELVDRPEVQEMESYYIAQALVDYITLPSPRKIILGDGIMRQEQLFSMIRQKVRETLNGYIRTRELEDMDSHIVPISFHDDQGVMGCIKLGPSALQA